VSWRSSRCDQFGGYLRLLISRPLIFPRYAVKKQPSRVLIGGARALDWAA
jgi:hypothetical protein